MPRKHAYSIGDSVGYWTIINQGKSPSGRFGYLCRCVCGTEKWVQTGSLRNGESKSCGCMTGRILSEQRTKHGKSRERIYKIWYSMMRRCNTPSSSEYHNYGGRGISVCDSWHDFTSFYEWAIQSGYLPLMTLDRIDNNGNYCPENCRWVDMKSQSNNRRTNLLIEYDGRTQTATQWADELGISRQTLLYRLKSGWSLSDLFTEPVEKRQYTQYMGRTMSYSAIAKELGIKRSTLCKFIDDGGNLDDFKKRPLGTQIEYNGKTQNISQWARELGLSKQVIIWRLDNGWSIERALTESTKKKQAETGGGAVEVRDDSERGLQDQEGIS